MTPSYTHGAYSDMSTSPTLRSTFAEWSRLTPSEMMKANVRDGRNMVLKIQIPATGNDDVLVYNKRRSFVCSLECGKNPVAYARIKKTVNEKGILGRMGYFAAELRSKDELAINIAKCLPESRF